ncbi:hypothetical protein IB270_33645 [Ensifer sp. ENS05]|uniref:DUF6896 domain-containing protein n=1 Tax=Ensifer sp. ENS05 TaxID=2769277 RepID=UPI00177EC41E|nr:hypothetical protein [Ensifer sp. ENS05]MBD9597771.1 hypothetical protein [Ensifer sp. ENS05]
MSELLILARNYLAEVEGCLELFEGKFGRRDIIKAWREGTLEREGLLNDTIAYQLHGRGCQVEFADHDVDFDFMDWDGTVGFDAWKLWTYARQFPERYPKLTSNADVEQELQLSIKAGEIKAVFPDGRYYQLVSSWH